WADGFEKVQLPLSKFRGLESFSVCRRFPRGQRAPRCRECDADPDGRADNDPSNRRRYQAEREPCYTAQGLRESSNDGTKNDGNDGSTIRLKLGLRLSIFDQTLLQPAPKPPQAKRENTCCWC